MDLRAQQPPAARPGRTRRVRPAPDVVSNRVLTVPNVISALRLVGVPIFLWLVLVPQADIWALIVLTLSGFTDYLDGLLARRWGQVSRVGQLLDPLADRAYILATLIALTLRVIIPWWFAFGLVARDVLLGSLYPLLRRRRIAIPPVHFVGKAATFNLLYAFPLLLLGDGSGTVALLARVFGWAFAIWGAGLYWWAGIIYALQVRRSLRAAAASSTQT